MYIDHRLTLPHTMRLGIDHPLPLLTATDISSGQTAPYSIDRENRREVQTLMEQTRK